MIALTSAYTSDLSLIFINNLMEIINKTLENYYTSILGITTSITYDSVKPIIKSPISFFFNEYLARKFNNGNNPVILLEEYTQKQIKEQLKNLSSKELWVAFHNPSTSMAIICSLMTLINRGDKVLIFGNCCGGYWVQGSLNNNQYGFPHELFDIIIYHNENITIDYFQLEKKIMEEKPQCLLMGFSSYTDIIDYKKIRKICDENHCYLLVDNAHDIGLMMGSIIPHNFNYGHIILGSTSKTIKGHRGSIMITEYKEFYDKFIHYTTSMQVERGLNIIMANYCAINYCFSEKYKNSINYNIAWAQYIYNFFNTSELELFNIKPLMKTHMPMVLLDIGYDANLIEEILQECKILISTFKIHGKYHGLRINTNNFNYDEKFMESFCKVLKIIIIENINISLSNKILIKNTVQKITNYTKTKDKNNFYIKNTKIDYTLDDNIFSLINNVLENQQHRLIMSTCSIFTSLSLNFQGSPLMDLGIDPNLNYNNYSPNKLKEYFHNNTNKTIKSFLNLKEDIWIYYNIPSATTAILVALLTLIKLDEKILIMAENNGGHYSQGSISASGATGFPKYLFNIKEFFIDETNSFNYILLENALKEWQPKVLLLGFSSYCGLLDYEKIRTLCDENNCYFIADCSHTIGLMLSKTIPHCLDHAHITVSSTYKTIPAVRGGLFLTKDYDFYKIFSKKMAMFQGERGLNLLASIYCSLEEVTTLGYQKKIQRAIEIAQYIEQYMIENQLGKPTVATKVHMATIDFGWDIREIFPILLDCNMDIGTFYVPHTNYYGLRFICTTLGILGYTDQDIHNILDNIKIILIKKKLISNEEITMIKKNIINITKKYKLFI